MVMKLAILAPEFLPTWGGVGIYTVNLVKELAKDKSYDIHLITPKRGDEYSVHRIKKEIGNINVHYISTANDSFIYNIKFQVAVLRDFPNLHKKYKFDMVHAMNLVHMPDIFLKFKQWNIPFITTVHTTIQTQFDYKSKPKLSELKTSELLSKIVYPYIWLMQRKYINSSQNLICVSDYVSKYVSNSRNNQVINNGVDTRRFKPAAKNNSIPTILFSGRLLYLKGVHVLVKAAKQVLKSRKVKFVFAGTGNLEVWRQNFEGISKKYFDFLGYVPYDRIHKLYEKADIFILPSLTESFPLTLLEAMSSGLPCIATSVGGVPEIIKHEKNGLLIESSKVRELRHAIIRLIDDIVLRKKLGNNARNDVMEKYSVERMVENTKNYYGSILGD